jgi:hypothetical protein
MLSLNDIDAVIKDIEHNLPEFLRAKDLITCGLFKTRSDISWAKRRGQTPPAVRLSSHKIVYPRASLCIWLREKALNGFAEESRNDSKA